MNDYLKNPNLYYILIPAIAAAWAVYTWTMAVPKAQKEWTELQQSYNKAQLTITDMLKLDSDRLDYEKLKGDSKEFNFETEVDHFATLAKIPSSNYKFTGRAERERGDKRTKGANISINPVDIQKLAIFISSILTPWPDLQCDSLRLTKQTSGPDIWKADIKFTYYY